MPSYPNDNYQANNFINFNYPIYPNSNNFNIFPNFSMYPCIQSQMHTEQQQLQNYLNNYQHQLNNYPYTNDNK